MELFRHQVAVSLRSKSPHDNMENYHKYICHLFKTHDNLTEEDKVEVGFRDYLQNPLQPLMDNLESQTYEVFEKDTPKYDGYEEAIYCALSDILA